MIIPLKVLKATVAVLFLYDFCVTFAAMRNSNKLKNQQYE